MNIPNGSYLWQMPPTRHPYIMNFIEMNIPNGSYLWQVQLTKHQNMVDSMENEKL